MSAEKLTYLSLFSGIGGLDLAVEAAGFECVGQVEWDQSCTRVLERWWPDVPRWGDVAEFDGVAYTYSRGRSQLAELNSRPHDARDNSASRNHFERLGLGPDLICGGFPCQPVSTAGRRKAQDDKRWLWPEFARVIRIARPRWVLVENVPGLLSAGEPAGSALGEVLRDLASLGFDARWHCVRASDVGAPHRRERIFLLATNTRHDARRLPDDAEEGRELRNGSRGEPWPADATSPHSNSDGRFPTLRPQSITGIHESDPGPEPGRADRGAIADAETRGLRRGEPSGRAGLAEPDDSAATDASDLGRERQGEARGGRSGPPDFAWGPYEPAIRRWERVMGAAPHPVDEKGRLDPAFVTWMQGFPAGWTEGMSRTQALKALGNAVVPQQAALALSILTESAP